MGVSAPYYMRFIMMFSASRNVTKIDLDNAEKNNDYTTHAVAFQL